MSASKKSLAAVLAVATASLAIVATPAVAHADHAESYGPNRTYLYSGISTMVLSYVPALVVATESHRDGDKNLYIPVVGPWMDLAQRSDCPPDVSCSNETVNKVLLVTDGIFQGLGALDIVGAFLFPESVEHRHEANLKPSFRVAPSHVSPTGYGLMAMGTF